MKKLVTAISLAFIMALSTGCSKNENTTAENGGDSEIIGEVTTETASEDTSEQPLTDEEKAQLDKLSSKGKIKLKHHKDSNASELLFSSFLLWLF